MAIQISRAEAKAQRVPRYFTGQPCVHGHVSERFTSSGACMECMREYSVAQRATFAKREPGRPQGAERLTPEQIAANTAAATMLRGKHSPGRKGLEVYDEVLAEVLAMARKFNGLAFPGATSEALDPQWEPTAVCGPGWAIGKISIAPQYREMFKAWTRHLNAKSRAWTQNSSRAEAEGKKIIGRANAWADSQNNGEPK